MDLSLGPEHIGELWRRMTAIYGHRWLSSYGPTDADDTWLRGLNGLSPSDLGKGLMACVESGDEWPPTLPAFRRLCKPDPYPYRNDVPALPVPEISKERALEHIAECRRALA